MRKRRQNEKKEGSIEREEHDTLTHSPVVVDVITERKQGSVTELDSMALMALLCTTRRAGSRAGSVIESAKI